MCPFYILNVVVNGIYSKIMSDRQIMMMNCFEITVRHHQHFQEHLLFDTR